MSPVQASCPGCGAAIEFKTGSSLVVVCPYCRSLVGRGDRNLEDLGKVAAVAETDSPLEIGLRGHYQGKPFEIVGRSQVAHSAGGVWDEWYVAFPKDVWGWLAEAQGRFYLTFPEAIPVDVAIPPFGQLQLGDAIPIGRGHELRVAETGRSRLRSAEGEIPYRLTPGQTYYFADLSGPDGTFGTLDYSDEDPQLFFGSEVTLDDLGIPKTYKIRREARQIVGAHVSCPNCGAALELRAPDKTERVTCPSCNSLLDVTEGSLRFLMTLKPGQVKPVLPLGAKGTLQEGPMTIIGMMQRSVFFDGVEYSWQEYLLYEPRIGFRWLVRSDDHWSYVKPIAPGLVSGAGYKRYCLGKKFKLFQKAEARVQYVIGEFYWKVTVGEVVETADYIGPPDMLSREISTTAVAVEGDLEEAIVTAIQPTTGVDQEINWSLGTFMRPDDVERAFGIQGLPWASGVAPNQPYPYSKIYMTWGLLSAIAGILGMILILTSPDREVFKRTYQLQRLEGADKTQVFFTDPIELRARRNIQITVAAPVSNSWLGVEGDFINEATGEIQPFFVPIEYYYGVDDGESWSEGSQQSHTLISALPAGNYTLRLEVAAEPNKPPPPLTIWVKQGVQRWLYLFLTLLLLAVVPGIMLLYHMSFEYRRWQDSEYSPFRSSGD